MLEQISWSTYFFIIAIAVLIYYVMIVLLYYRRDFKDILNKNVKDKKVSDEQSEISRSDGVQELEQMVIKIKGILLEVGTGASQAELIKKLGKTLANYDGLQKPAFRVALNNYIIKQANELCGVRFSEEELESEWKNLSH